MDHIGPKMVDGSHKYSMYNVEAIPWTLLDSLFRSKIVGVTYNLSENSGCIIQGAKKFFKPVAGYEGFEGKETVIAPTSAVMSDEGPAFPIVATVLGCHHILDRKHLTQHTQQIATSWHGVEDQTRYKNTIHNILNSKTEQILSSNVVSAEQTYVGHPKALALVHKISSLHTKVCWTHTSKFFTAGHISDQRSEGTNSAVKGNGQLKQYLSECTMSESVNRVSQVLRKKEEDAIDKLGRIRQNKYFVCPKYFDCLKNSRSKSCDIFQVKSMQDSASPTKFAVLNNGQWSMVDLEGDVQFCGKIYKCFVCSCPFFTSSWIICECACIAARTQGVTITSASNVHPFWLVYNHPRWNDACKQVGLSSRYDVIAQ
jgi:hypothetical protein